jgi:exopolyphosphatase / guanosine-5'-triphosphate,3'-diphosphate pyrophosphatase
MPQTVRATAPHRGYARCAVRCACIDIGSNTTRLLVADVVGRDATAAPTLAPVVERRAFTHLGRACRAGGAVPAAAREALVAVVSAQAEEARALGAEALRVVATAALRRSADGLATCHVLAAAAGAPVELLNERDEARLAFTGATCALSDAFDGSVAVVDVGGGSAQVVVGTCDTGAGWSVSLPLGSGDLAAAHLRADPPSGRELAGLRAAVEETLAGIALPPVEHALAVGGSATSLRRLAGPRLQPATLERALATLLVAPAVEIARTLRIAPERARLLPAGIVVLAAVAQRIGPLEVARGGLREGVLRELAATA